MLKFLVTLNTIILLAPICWANEAFVFKSPITGQDVYELVKSSDSGKHKSAPGVYEIDKKTGAVRLITKGEVLGLNRGFNGVLGVSSVSSDSQGTDDAVMVLDGYLTILNRNSSTRKKNSILKVGTEGNVQVVDILQSLPVSIPPIHSLDDVNVVALQNELFTSEMNLAQVFLVSLKAPNTFGAGFTLAFALERRSGKSAVPKLLNDKVYVIGYNYLNENQLNQLVATVGTSSNFKVYAPSAINMVAARMEARKDQPLVSNWLNQLNTFSKTLTQNNRKVRKNNDEKIGVPTFSLNSESIDLTTQMVDVVLATPFALLQSYNPISGQWEVYLEEPSDEFEEYFNKKSKRKVAPTIGINTEFSKPAMIGELDLDKAKKSYRIFMAGTTLQKDGPEAQSSYLLSASGQTLVLLSSDSGSNYMKGVIPEVQFSLGECKKLNFTHAIGKLGEKNTRNHYLLVSFETNTRKKLTKALVFEEKGGELTFLNSHDLMSSYMTEPELEERLTYEVRNSKGSKKIVFDNVTPVKGVNYYRKKDITERTVPLFNLESIVSNTEDVQHYAKEEEEVIIIPEKVYYKKYNPAGAVATKTGIYLNTSETDETRKKDLVVNGELFFKRKGRGNKNVLEQSDISFDNMSDYHSFPSMGAAIFPINPNVGRALNTRSFSMALAVWSKTRGYKTSLRVSTVDFPFESVQAVKIIHGKRLKQEYITVLMFLDGPHAQGIYAMNYKISLDIAKKQIMVTAADGGWVTKEYVTPQSLKQRLKTDTAGEYYWIHDVEADIDTSKFSVRSLLSPNKLIHPNRDGRVKLRMNEVYEESVAGVATTGGQWLTIGKNDVFSSNKWFEEVWKKHEKKVENAAKKSRKYRPSIFPLFRKFLEKFADKTKRRETRKRQVVIVEDRMQKEMLTQLYFHALTGEGRFSLDPKVGRDFDLHIYDETATAGEIIRELEHIAATSHTRGSMLLVEASKILGGGELVDDSENNVDENESQPEEKAETYDEEEEEYSGLSRMLLLATDGKARSLREAKRMIGEPAELPMVMFSTPEEWDALKNKYPKENEAGLFDSFEVNRSFQTSSWTLWPPYTNKATPLVKELAKLPISKEEKRVFPTLEKLLVEAVKGESSGKQRIVIIPEDLKKLVLKLVVGRWASSNIKNGDEAWSHGNENLDLFMLSGSREDNRQEDFRDNFNAMKGAAENRSVALFGTLEDVILIGRPYSDKREFRIKDPASTSGTDLYSEVNKAESIDQQDNDTDLDAETSILVENRDALLADIDDLESNGEQSSSDQDEIRDLRKQVELLDGIIAQQENAQDMLDGNTEGSNVDESNSAALPHALWWIAAEGSPIQPKKTKGWDIDQEVDGSLSTILIGTQEEFNALAQEMSFESKFFDIEDHFEILELSPPSAEVKYNLVKSLFSRSQISSLEYQFQLEELKGEKAKSQLIYFLINRAEQIAIQENQEQTSAFVRTFSELRRSLVEDVELRKNRLIDKNYLERLFARIFPLPLNPSSLRADDPIIKLMDTKSSVREMNDIGYKGSPDLKKRIFGNIVSQTRGADEGRPIPSSMIFYGDTSRGKTFFFKSLVRMLDLELYDRGRPNNENASAIIIPCSDLTEDDNTGDPTKITVKQAIDDVKDLIAQPNGHRAYILFDDAHKCASSDKIRREIFAFIQSFFETIDGLMRVKKKGSNEIREVPVQNLNLFMTVNPASNRKRVREYTDGEDDLIKHVLAALSTNSWELEESFLARWTDVINFDKFPRSAKVPELVSRIRQASKSSSHIVLVEPDAVDKLVDEFPDAHAREFLSPAAASITQVPNGAVRAPLYIVSPKTILDEGDVGQTESKRTYIEASSLGKKVREITQVDAVTKDNVDSQLRLVSFILQGFRTQLYNNLVLEASNTESLDLAIPGLQGAIKRNFILGMITHINEGRYLPMNEVRIDGTEMSYLSKSQREELYELQKKEKTKKPFFPIDFSIGQSSDYIDAQSFVSDGASRSRERSRRDVMSEYASKLEVVLKRMVRVFMRMSDYNSVENVRSWSESEVREWFESLREEDLEPKIKAINQEIIDIFKAFQQDIIDISLTEERENSNAAQLNYYDQARLFAYVIDRTVSRLPWGLMAKFTMDIVNNSEDMSMGQKPSFIDYAYSNQVSPFAIVTPDFLAEVLDKKVAARNITSFSNKCNALLSKGAQSE